MNRNAPKSLTKQHKNWGLQHRRQQRSGFRSIKVNEAIMHGCKCHTSTTRRASLSCSLSTYACIFFPRPVGPSLRSRRLESKPPRLVQNASWTSLGGFACLICIDGGGSYQPAGDHGQPELVLLLTYQRLGHRHQWIGDECGLTVTDPPLHQRPSTWASHLMIVSS